MTDDKEKPMPPEPPVNRETTESELEDDRVNMSTNDD